MQGPPHIGIVVLNWNGWEDTQECLESLRRLRYASYDVYVVDNGSTDGSPDLIQEAFPEVHLIRLPENRGFSGGMNAGLQAALRDGCRFVLCLNNDMVAEPDLLDALAEAAREDGVVVYPAIYRYEDPDVIDNLGQRIHLFTGLTHMVGHGSSRVPPEIQADYTEVPLLPGRLVEEMGGWAEDYFAFYEDADLGLRLKRAGWELRCVPEARVLHKRGRTAGRVPGLLSYYGIRNRLLVVRRHGSPWHYVTTVLHILLLTLPYIGLRCTFQKGYKHSFRHILLGLADGLLPWRRHISRTWRIGATPMASTQ